MMHDIIVAILVLSGGIFCFAAGMGVLRLPDLLTRMHASTKAGTLGSGLILMAVAVQFAEGTSARTAWPTRCAPVRASRRRTRACAPAAGDGAFQRAAVGVKLSNWRTNRPI